MTNLAATRRHDPSPPEAADLPGRLAASAAYTRRSAAEIAGWLHERRRRNPSMVERVPWAALDGWRVPGRQRDRHPGGDGRTLARRDRDVPGGDQVRPGVTGVGIPGNRQIRLQSAQRHPYLSQSCHLRTATVLWPV